MKYRVVSAIRPIGKKEETSTVLLETTSLEEAAEELKLLPESVRWENPCRLIVDAHGGWEKVVESDDGKYLFIRRVLVVDDESREWVQYLGEMSKHQE